MWRCGQRPARRPGKRRRWRCSALVGQSTALHGAQLKPGYSVAGLALCLALGPALKDVAAALSFSWEAMLLLLQGIAAPSPGQPACCGTARWTCPAPTRTCLEGQVCQLLCPACQLCNCALLKAGGGMQLMRLVAAQLRTAGRSAAAETEAAAGGRPERGLLAILSMQGAVQLHSYAVGCAGPHQGIQTTKAKSSAF